MSRIHESTSNLQRVLRSQVQPVFLLWAIDCCGRSKIKENIILASSRLNQNYAAHCLCASRQMKENQDTKSKRRSARMKHISNMLMQHLREPYNLAFFLVKESAISSLHTLFTVPRVHIWLCALAPQLSLYLSLQRTLGNVTLL